MLIVALFLQETAGLSATEAGLATLPVPVLSFFLARRFGTLAGVHGPRLFMAVGPLIAAAGYLLMATAARAVQLLDADAARAGGVRPGSDDHGVAADGGDPGRGRSRPRAASARRSTTRCRGSRA